jgi:hypothetical protein
MPRDDDGEQRPSTYVSDVRQRAAGGGAAHLIAAAGGRRDRCAGSAGGAPVLAALARDVAHGAGEGELGVEPDGGVEPLAERGVRVDGGGDGERRLPCQPLLDGLRAQPAHPLAQEPLPHARHVRGRAVLRHAAALAPHAPRLRAVQQEHLPAAVGTLRVHEE